MMVNCLLSNLKLNCGLVKQLFLDLSFLVWDRNSFIPTQ